MANCICVVQNSFCGAGLPQEMMVDANFFISYLNVGSGLSGYANTFLTECQNHNKSLFITSTSLNEIHHRVEQTAIADMAFTYGLNPGDNKYKSRGGHKLLQKDLFSKFPGYYPIVSQSTQKGMDSIVPLVNILYPDGSINSQLLCTVQQLCSGSVEVNDAEMILIANSVGINTYVSNDRGLLNLDGINIIALPQGKYNNATSSMSFNPHSDLLNPKNPTAPTPPPQLPAP